MRTEIGESIQAALIEYRATYPRPFEQRYQFYSVYDGHKERSREDFDQFAAKVKKLLRDENHSEDCIGTLNFVRGQTYGFLCMDIPSYEKLDKMFKDPDEDLRDFKLEKVWPDKVADKM